MSIHIRNYTNFLRIKFAASVLLFFCLHSSVSAGPDQRKSYLQIEQNKSSETNDLGITSIGALVFNGNTMGRGTLTQLKSDKNGDALALELGGGYVFN